jgi:hypothetical protein
VIAAPSFTLSQVDPDCGSTNGEIVISNLTPNTAYDVSYNDGAVVDAGTDQTICEGETIILTGAGAQNYVWDNGVVDGTSFAPSNTSTYTVVATDANGCENTAQVTITVAPAPTPSFEGDELVGCIPHTVEYTNNS